MIYFAYKSSLLTHHSHIRPEAFQFRSTNRYEMTRAIYRGSATRPLFVLLLFLSTGRLLSFRFIAKHIGAPRAVSQSWPACLPIQRIPPLCLPSSIHETVIRIHQIDCQFPPSFLSFSFSLASIQCLYSSASFSPFSSS